jgi:enhanced entry protein EnhC
MKRLNLLLCMAVLPAYSLAQNNEPVQYYHQGEYAKASAGLAAQPGKESDYLLGKMYMQGFGVSKDTIKGIGLITKAANQKNVDAQMYLAKYYLSEENNFKEAFNWFKKAAELGNLDAQMFCATTYMHGTDTVQQNKDLARKYIIEAAKQGNADAQYELAKIFINSRHAKDKALGLIWLKKAADQKNADAQYLLGSMLFNGDGVKKDTAAAVELLKKAAADQNKYAGSILGEYYLSLPRNHRNFKESLHWYEKSAQAGNAEAQNRLGQLYLTTWEDFSDPQKAVKWLTAAAGQGDKTAQLELAKMYAAGTVVPKNLSKAFEWRLRLAEEGDANAQRQVGMMYFKGEGVTENKSLAVKWLTKAANNNDYIAKFKLDSVKKAWNNKKKVQQANGDKGIPTPKLIKISKSQIFQPKIEMVNPDTIPIRDFLKILGKLEYGKDKPELMIPRPQFALPNDPLQQVSLLYEVMRQANLGYAKAQFQLGNMYELGIGVKADMAQAIEWYQKAAKLNYLKADYALAVFHLEGKGLDKNYKLAEQWLRIAALKGDRKAQFLLGQLYEFGFGKADSKNYIPKNLTAAKAMYSLASGSGMPRAQYNLAQLYISGLLDESQHTAQQKRYHQLAFELFKQAAAANVADAKIALAFYFAADSKLEKDKRWALEVAQHSDTTKGKFLLALMYSRGIATDKDQSKAIKLYQTAVLEDNPIAQYILGSYYGLNNDTTQARRLLTKASNANIPFASYNLAILDYKNNNTSQFLHLLEKAQNGDYQQASILLADYYVANQSTDSDLKLAASIYQNLANNGNVKAQIKLAYMYQKGLYHAKNYQEALNWYQRAADKNNVIAEYALGNMFQIGQGTNRDLDTAKRWYERAAAENFAPAQVALGFINETDLHNYRQAEYWYRLAANNNNPVGLYNLGLLYDYGKGVAADEVMAKALFDKAEKLCGARGPENGSHRSSLEDMSCV